MRKVALITDGWRRLFTYAWPAGILQRIKERDEEVNLYILTVLATGAEMLGTTGQNIIFLTFRICQSSTALFWN